MDILERIEVPTGDILIVQGDKGKLEMLSIGDYGKEVNLKADCLGLTRTPDQVRHTALLPLQEKWVVTISTQYGCSMGCTFCDVPSVGPGKNATVNDLLSQVQCGIDLHPEVTTTKRLNLHFARMGEPTLNPHVLTAARVLLDRFAGQNWGFHPVVSTMMPKGNSRLNRFIKEWVEFKNVSCGGNAGLQLSINSTDDLERQEMFSGNACSLSQIAGVMYGLKPVGRKFTLNFALAGYTIDPRVLLRFFNPEHYIIKLTPMHKTSACVSSGTKTEGDYTTYEPYEHHEEALKSAGYDVLVFIASREEDEGRITCGNAILSGTRPVVGNEWGGESGVLETFERKEVMSEDRMLKWFEFEHLPEHLQKVSAPFGLVARQLCHMVDPGPERTVALRKLLEAKDAAVRAVVNPGG